MLLYLNELNSQMSKEAQCVHVNASVEFMLLFTDDEEEADIINIIIVICEGTLSM